MYANKMWQWKDGYKKRTENLAISTNWGAKLIGPCKFMDKNAYSLNWLFANLFKFKKYIFYYKEWFLQHKNLVVQLTNFTTSLIKTKYDVFEKVKLAHSNWNM